MPLRFGRNPAQAERLRWRSWKRIPFIAIFALGMIANASYVRAEPERGEPRVARVGFHEGEVSYLEADAEEWAPVSVNAPLVTGDRFYSGPDGRAELQLPGGFFARLSNSTELDLLQVDSAASIVRIGVGTGTFRLRDAPARRHVEVSTPAAALVARSRGVYRVDVAEDGRTTVVVREGELDAYQGDERYRLTRGRAAEFDVGPGEGDIVPAQFYDAGNYELDAWDEWEASRAQRFETSPSLRYVSGDVYGVADLDEYGTWSEDATYGPIWRPTSVAVGWAPYTNGRWVWQDPWGWSWVDYAPWGWAPSHYGRWVYARSAWAWAPGPIVTRPIYAPATVGFFGVSAPGFSFSVGIGGGSPVGWVPLGWGEPIVPWWGGVGGVTIGQPWWGGWGGPRIVNNTVINNINNINVNDIRYANWDRPGGFTAVDRGAFARGEIQRIDLPPDRFDRFDQFARPIRGSLDVVPERASLFAARHDRIGRGAAVRPSEQVLGRRGVVTREVPNAPARFEERRDLIQRSRGAPVPTDELRQMARTRGQPRVETIAATGRRSVVPEATARFDRSRLGERTGRAQARDGTAAQPGEPRDRIGRTEGSPDGGPGRPGEPAGSVRDERLRRGGARGGPDDTTAETTAERASVRGTRERGPATGREPGQASEGGIGTAARDGGTGGQQDRRERVGRGSPDARESTSPTARTERPGRDRTGSERARRAPTGGSERGELGGPQAQPGRTERTGRGATSRPERDAVQGAPRGQRERGEQSRRAPASETRRSTERPSQQRERGEQTRRAPAPEMRQSTGRPSQQRERAERARSGPDVSRQRREPATSPNVREPRSRPEAREPASSVRQPQSNVRPERAERGKREPSAARTEREPTQRNPKVRQPSRDREPRESMRAPARQPERRQSRVQSSRQSAPQRASRMQSSRERSPERQARAQSPRQSAPQRAPAVRSEARGQRTARSGGGEQVRQQSAPRQAEQSARAPQTEREKSQSTASRDNVRRKGGGRNRDAAEARRGGR